jgi:hypothetical protein
MDFNKSLGLFEKGPLILLALALSLGACTYDPNKKDDYMIGSKLENISSLNRVDGEQNSKVVLFDETTRRIRQFDLNAAKYERGLKVRSPDEDHYLLFHQEGRYVVDLTKKHLTIFNKKGEANDDPIHFEGHPRSAAFRPELGYLVIYDDLQSVGILKLGLDGQVEKTLVLGSAFGIDTTIAAGDLLADGRLVLSLSDDSIVLVDVEQTLNTGEWVSSKFASGVSDISWVAPVNGNDNQIFIKGVSKLALLDLTTHAILSEVSLNHYEVEKVSKLSDAHVILRSYSNGGLQPVIKIAYPQAGTIRTKTLYSQGRQLLSSHLNLAKNLWTYVDSDYYKPNWYNDVNQSKEHRVLKRYRVSDMLAISTKDIPEKAQLQLALDYFFALFPSEYGYAVRYEIDSDAKVELKMFNAKDI